MNNSVPSLLCPPLMNDGRHGTDYRPSADVNLEIQKQNKIENNNDYREFLIKNASEIMKQNLSAFESFSACTPYQNTVDPNGSDSVWSGYDESIKYSPVI